MNRGHWGFKIIAPGELEYVQMMRLLQEIQITGLLGTENPKEVWELERNDQ